MPSSSSIVKLLVASVIASVLVSPNACAEPTSWRTDCVGRLQVGLPGEATIAAVAFEDFLEDIRRPSQAVRCKFPDCQPAPGVRVLYGGEIAISNPLDTRSKEAISEGFVRARDSARASLAAKKPDGPDTLVLSDVRDMPADSIAWTDGQTVKTLIGLTDRMVIARVNSSESPSAGEALAREISANIVERRVFDVPKQRGVCIPGAFVSAGNPDFRNIGSMYRINAHPDVTVFLRDSNAAVYAEEVLERNAQPQQKIRSFWAQYGMRKSVKRLASLSGVFASHNIVIAGRDGKVSTVEIERSDGHIDFGFYASVRGVPGDIGAPNIELLVVSEGERAKAKGIASIDKERFLQLARDIAETVQLRK